MIRKQSQKIIVVVGPTSSGKSDLAIKIAQKFNGEIISADSRQVYRGMDIGTGKVARDSSRNFQSNPKSKISNKEYYSSGIKHHLIDMASPKKQFTADEFKKLGEKAIKEILAKNKVPIIVGGTGFYIDVLLGRMAVAEVPPNPELRKRFDKLSAEHLFKMLRKLDPERAKTIDPKNKRRLIRALEIYVEGRKLKVESSLKTTLHLPYSTLKTLWFGINPGREKLAVKIKKRLDERLKQGMIKEVMNLRKQGESWKRLDDFGLEYRQISEYLKNQKIRRGQTSKFKDSEYYDKLLKDIIKYSKRQITWFKRNKEIHWIRNTRETEKLIRVFLKS